MSVLLIAGLLGAIVQPCSAQSKKNEFYENSYAIVIGIDQYKDPKWAKLKHAVDDARDFATYLKNTGFVVSPLYNEEATREAILTKMVEIARQLKKNDRVLFFFSGHGFTETINGKDWGYIVPVEGTSGTATYISMDELKRHSQMMGTAKHQLFIMDSCYGGSLGRAEVTRGAIPFAVAETKTPDYLLTVTKANARQVMAAGGKDQQVVDGSTLFPGHSLFTGALLSGLIDGRADTHHNGYITFSELYSYVQAVASNKYQTPYADILDDHTGGRDFVFISPITDRRKILIRPSFEALNSAEDVIMKLVGPKRLWEAFLALQQSARVWNVEFSLGDSSPSFGVRGDTSSAALQGSDETQYDYVLDVKYTILDNERIRVEPQLKKNSPSRLELRVEPLELGKGSFDYDLLAKSILKPFAPAAEFHLHLQSVDCMNCEGETDVRLKSSVESWLTQLNFPRMKFVKEQDNSPEADINVHVLMFVTPAGNEAQLAIVAGYAPAKGKGDKTLARRIDPKSWETSLKEIQKDFLIYLSELVKQF